MRNEENLRHEEVAEYTFPRTFSIADYETSGAGSRLLLNCSAIEPDEGDSGNFEPKNIHLMFYGVQYIKIPQVIMGLRIRRPETLKEAMKYETQYGFHNPSADQPGSLVYMVDEIDSFVEDPPEPGRRSGYVLALNLTINEVKPEKLILSFKDFDEMELENIIRQVSIKYDYPTIYS
jgi:hypothetical protein